MRRALVAAVVLAVPGLVGAQQSIEMLRANAELALSAAHLQIVPQISGILGEKGAKLEVAGVPLVSQGAPLAVIDLDGIHNKVFKTSLQYNINGINLWISAARNRSGKDASVCLSFTSKDPFFYNLRWLVGHRVGFRVGARKRLYEFYVDPVIFDTIKSRVVLRNAESGREEIAITLESLLAAVMEQGERLLLAAVDKKGNPVFNKNGNPIFKEYHLFYYDDFREGDAKSGGGMDKTLQNIGLLAKDDDRITIIPAEQVGAEPRQFTLATGKKIALQKDGTQLSIFDLP